jgi:cellulose synthase/poly-beta-1,6-N-acetylglucosamine synthase-like glycosyltransferase
VTPPARAAAWAVGLLTLHSALNARLLRRPPGTHAPAPHLPTVSLLLPVRDEAARLTPTLRSLLAQTHPCEVLVLDDGSTDGTADVVRELGVEPISGAAPPAGWLGKPYACQQLADAAHGQVLVFVDADVVLAPQAVAATMALLVATGLDLVSPYPRQEATGRARLVQPLLQWSWLTFLPLRLAERSPRPALSAANGQLLAVRRAAYDRAGGHAAVRAEVVEDVALLRAVKRAGGTGGVVDGTALATCRMYDTWPELSAGYRKSLHTVPLPVTALLLALYVAPAVAALRGSRAGAVAVAAAVAGRVVTGRRTGARVWPDAAAHPLSVTLLGWLTVRSHLDRRRGRLRWKGRTV